MIVALVKFLCLEGFPNGIIVNGIIQTQLMPTNHALTIQIVEMPLVDTGILRTMMLDLSLLVEKRCGQDCW